MFVNINTDAYIYYHSQNYCCHKLTVVGFSRKRTTKYYNYRFIIREIGFQKPGSGCVLQPSCLACDWLLGQVEGHVRVSRRRAAGFDESQLQLLLQTVVQLLQ